MDEAYNSNEDNRINVDTEKEHVMNLRAKLRIPYQVLMVYRVLAFLSILGLFIVYMVRNKNRWRDLLVFLSNWGHVLTMVYFIHVAIGRRDNNVTYKYGTLLGLLLGLNFVISAFYWLFIYGKLTQTDPWFIRADYLLHILSFVFVFIDYCLNKIYIKFNATLTVLLLLVVVYCIVNIISVFGFKFIPYDFMTWRDLKSAIFLFAAIAVALGMLTIFWTLQKCKFDKIDNTGYDYLTYEELKDIESSNQL